MQSLSQIPEAGKVPKGIWNGTKAYWLLLADVSEIWLLVCWVTPYFAAPHSLSSIPQFPGDQDLNKKEKSREISAWNSMILQKNIFSKIPCEVNCHVREEVAIVSRGLHEHTLCAYTPCIYNFTHC